ncbi:MAG TPA: LPS export ABC transporter periplasmic protein LptC [Steroidobacteraceae bacterium]|jgi:LPS export ABC transporter protein LptC|nr:LPS export ABC transporter periplasmic protein LptC [Steroidobacteraceae bacterium]
MIYRLFAILTIVAVIVASLLLSQQQGAAPPSATVRENAFNEGYSASDASLVETGADGRPLYTLDAATIRQLPNEGQVLLTQVRMSFHDADGNPWTVTADRGDLVQATQQARLAGNVRVSGMLPASGAAQFSTTALSVDIRADIVSTREPVQMIWSGRPLSSVGLIANLKDHRVQLESNVHGTFSQ